MDKCEQKLRLLPDIEMYGGSTAPWEISLMNDSGRQYYASEMSGLNAVLTISPYTVTLGAASGSSNIPPLVTINATISADVDNHAIATFEFSKSDTINLRGKFIYQLEFINDSDVRIGQGYLYIRQNINRSSGD